MKWLLLASLPLLITAQRLTEKENEKLQWKCGKSDKQGYIRRSMHTKQVSRSEAPWVARLDYTTNYSPNITIQERNKNSSHTIGWCSGSLISPRHVITAAHCVETLISTCEENGKVLSSKPKRRNIDRFSVLFTESCKSGCNAKGGFYDIRLPVKKIYASNSFTGLHCKGSQVFPRNDIAVIELAKDVKYSDQLYPVCLNGDHEVKHGEDLTHFGYGKGHNITNGSLTYDHDYDEMRKYIGTVGNCSASATKDVICHSHDKASLCKGDNGGGLLVYNEGRASVVAVASVGGNGMSSLVKDHMNWICAATGVCSTQEALRNYNNFKDTGLTQGWYETLLPYTGTAVYV